MLIDSHCHLDFPDFGAELDAVVGRARQAGVGTMLTIGTKLRAFEGVRKIAERYEDVWCTVGIHPHEAAEEPIDESTALVEHAKHARVVGIGEAGLDYYYEHSPKNDQVRNFRAHIAASRETGLPLIVHARDADDDLCQILTEESGKGAFPGLIHCFSSTAKLARTALDLGMLISISGIVTFKKADELRAIIADVPLDRLLVETDSPYLAPIPHRGKRNEPAFVAHTAATVARLKNVEPERLANATTDNFFRLFAKARRPV
ncbi:MAG: TatD family hydrolase [Alphaproteobacteria bacterium]|nr:TatD family hydrolase [Alphaproteobacteria bacterium]